VSLEDNRAVLSKLKELIANDENNSPNDVTTTCCLEAKFKVDDLDSQREFIDLVQKLKSSINRRSSLEQYQPDRRVTISGEDSSSHRMVLSDKQNVKRQSDEQATDRKRSNLNPYPRESKPTKSVNFRQSSLINERQYPVDADSKQRINYSCDNRIPVLKSNQNNSYYAQAIGEL
jgi:hypothetical protein